MSNPLDRFTQRSRQILSYTQANATLLEHAEIMPCHMLLAFYQISEGRTNHLMKELGIDADEVLSQIDALYQPQVYEKLKLASTTRQVLQDAAKDADDLGSKYVVPDNLVVAIASSSDPIARAMFEAKGLTLAKVQEQVHKLLQHRQELLPVGVMNTAGGIYQMASWLMHLAGITPPPPPPASLPNPITDAERQVKIRQRFEADVTNMTALVTRLPTHPTTDALLRKRGLAHLWLARHDEGIADLTKAIETAPNEIENYLVRIAAYELQGEFDLAMQDCDKVFMLAPHKKTAYSHRASIRMQQGEFDAAVTDLETLKTVELEPLLKAANLEAISNSVTKPIEYEFGYAQLAFQRGEFMASAEQYRHVVSRISAFSLPTHSCNLGFAYYSLGKSLDALGDVDGAVDAFKQARNQWSLPPLKRSQAWLAELHAYIEKHRP